MVLKTRSWSLLTVPRRSSPRVAISNEAYTRPEPGVCSKCRGRSEVDVGATKLEKATKAAEKVCEIARANTAPDFKPQINIKQTV